MRKLFITLAVTLTASFAFANNDENGDKNATHSQPKNEVIAQTETEDEEAVYCKVPVPGTTDQYVECWFCDCKELAKAVLKNAETTSTAN